MARLTLTLLGGFQARIGAGSPLTLPTKKIQACLAYLALPSGREHTRDKLAALLWGELSQGRARHSLRQALLALRRAVEPVRPACLCIQGATIVLNPDAVDVDAVNFDRLVGERTQAVLEQAVELYRGDLLDGLTLQEPPFEAWLMAERERLRELALEALAGLLAFQRAAGAADAALQTGLRLIALDPLQEPVHRTLMRLYAQLGRRGSALNQYQLCLGILQRELAVDPEEETTQLYQDILRRRPSVMVPSELVISGGSQPFATMRGQPLTFATDIPLIGRDREMARMRAALAEAISGRGQVVTVVGEAGVGKTRLVTELAAELPTVGGRVLIGRSYESEQILPFGPWVDAFRSGQILDDEALLGTPNQVWRSELARLLPELVRPGLPAASDDQLRLFESVAHLVERLAALQPVVLILEDVHWADDMSLRLLAFIARRTHRWHVLLLTTGREEELADASAARRTLAEVGREPHAASLKLTPLSRPDTVLLVRSLSRVGSETEALARIEEQVWGVSEGNPFVAVETTRALQEGSIIVSPSTLHVAERVRELIARRLERLSDRAYDLAEVAAVIGREFDFPLLERAAQLGELAAAKALEELVRRRALQGIGERFACTHERIQAVVYDQLLQPQRKLLHRRVGEAIEELYGANLEPYVSALGVHYLRAEVWAKALVNLWRAGSQAAARSAYGEAVACLEQALAVLPHLPESRRRLERAADLHLELRTCLHALGELAPGAEHAREAERLAQELGDARRLGIASVYLTHYCWLTGALHEGIAFGRRAHAIAEDLGDLPLSVSATFYLGLVHSYLGEYLLSEDYLRRTIRALEGRRSERCGLVGFPAVLAPAVLAEMLAECGRFDEGATCAEEAIQISEALNHAYSSITAWCALGRLHIVRGEFPSAITLLERALHVAIRWHLTVRQANIMEGLGLAYVCSRRLAEGLDLLERAVKVYEVVGRRDATGIIGEAYLLAGRLEEAAAYARWALPHARGRSERRLEALALWLLAGIAARRDPPDLPDSQASYLEALTLAAQLGMRPLVAHCHLGLGNLYRRTGRWQKAQEHLGTATAMYREMDMQFWLEQAKAEISLAPSTHEAAAEGLA
jgi:DNA-binding SARP family transcriptional activator